MVRLTDLMTFLQDYMGFDDTVPKIDGYLVNGLQVAGAEEIHKIVTGVSANMRLFTAAVEQEAQAMLVHHSMNPPNSVYLEADKIFMSRLRYLLKHNLSLIGYHYLLDGHPEIGHNAAIIKALGGQKQTAYGPDGHQWGWIAEIPGGAPLSQVLNTCRELFQNNGFYYTAGPQTVTKFVCISGGAPPRPGDYQWLMSQNIDLFITGEVREWNQELCREAGINMVAGGHYNTEIIGLHALSQVIQAEFDVDIEFVDIPNPV